MSADIRKLTELTELANRLCRSWASSSDPLAANQAINGGAEDLGGFCAEAAFVLAKLLEQRDFGYRMVWGYYSEGGRALRAYPHVWLESENLLLDPTVGQFDRIGPSWRVLQPEDEQRKSYIRMAEVDYIEDIAWLRKNPGKAEARIAAVLAKNYKVLPSTEK